jgi:hypothetical protein
MQIEPTVTISLHVDFFETIDAKTKSALTRQYNSTGHTSQALVAAQMVGKKGRASATAPATDEEDIFGDDYAAAKAVDEDEKVDDIDMSLFMKKSNGKGAKKVASRAVASSSKATSGAAGKARASKK